MYTSKTNDNVSEEFSQAKSRKVYLPEGTDWYDFWTDEKLKGGSEIEKAAPIDITPLYIKAGSVLPWGPKVQYAAEKKWDDLEIRVYPGANGEFHLVRRRNRQLQLRKGGCIRPSCLAGTMQLKNLLLAIEKENFRGC